MKRRWSVVLIALAVVAFFVAATSRAQSDLTGRVVTTVEFRADTPFDVARLGELITVRQGSPLSIRDTQSSIQALFATGDFRDIRVDATPEGTGVHVLFILSINYRVNEITFEGIGKTKDAADRELQVHRGDVLSLDSVDRSAVAITELLHRRGYFEAIVDPETQFARELNRANVVFHVTLGPLAKISSIDFEGSLAPYTPAELMKAMKRKPGDTFRLSKERDAAERLKRFLLRRNYRRADVRYLGETYEPTTKTARVRYRVDVGPIVKVEVEGVPRRTVRRLIPFRRYEAYSEDVIERASDKIIDEYQKRGYFFVSVDTEERTADNHWVVIFHVNPGERYTLAGVNFQGNQKVTDKTLTKVVAVAPPGGFRRILGTLFRRPGGVTQEQLHNDRDELETYYRLHGFTEPKISDAIVKPVAAGKLEVTFPIVEGPQTIVSTVHVEGNQQVPANDLPLIELHTGSELNPQLLGADILALKTFYADRGNVEIQVSPRVDFSPDKTSAVVTYQIAEGPKVLVGEVITRGNTYTHTNLILKKSHLEKGEPFSYKTLLEAQRNLYRLGVFQRVDLLPEQGGSILGERNVVIQVEEGKDLTLAGALGYSTEQGARGTASISHRNLFGTGRYLGLEGRVSQRENRFYLTYREPFIFKLDVPTQLTLFRSAEVRPFQTGNDITILRKGSFIEASRIVGERTRWSLHYEYRIVDFNCQHGCETSGPLPLPDIPREDQRVRISSLTPTFFWDKRDDAVDPHRGSFTSASIEYAFPILGAKTNFLKGYSEGAWFKPLVGRSLLAVGGRIGAIHPLHSGVECAANEPNCVPLAAIPFSERFFAGGESTHRAFSRDRLGVYGEVVGSEIVPPGATIIRDPERGLVAIGGNALLLTSAELRFPLIGSLSGAVFVDGGQVWRSIDAVEFSQMRWGAGGGLRYLTPVGPLRFDVGWKLDRKPFEDPYAAFLSLGYAF